MGEAEQAGVNGECLHLNRAVAPIDCDRVLVARVGVGEVARERDRFVFEDHRLVKRQRCDLRRVVDRIHGDRERLVRASVVPAAVVAQVDRDRGQAVGIRGRCVRQIAGGVDGWLRREQAVVVVARVECQTLARLVRRPGRDARGPAGHHLRARILVHHLVRPLGERRGVVYRRHVDRHRGRAGQVRPVADLELERRVRVPVLVGVGLELELPTRDVRDPNRTAGGHCLERIHRAIAVVVNVQRALNRHTYHLHRLQSIPNVYVREIEVTCCKRVIRIFVCRHRTVTCCRGGVRRGHDDVHCCRIGDVESVDNGEVERGERVAAVVCRRGVD